MSYSGNFYKNILQSSASGDAWIHQSHRSTWRSAIIGSQIRKAPLGKNEIRKTLSIKAKNAGLQLEGKRVSNHSARKTCISRLLYADKKKKISVILSRVDRSESRDESISSVQNQEYQVATRSTAAIATSNVMEMHWLASHERASTLFHCSRFCRCKRTSIIGSTFQIFHGDVKILKSNRNKRPFVIESDEDDWLHSYFFRFQLISTAAFSCSITTNGRNIYIFLRSTKIFGKKNKQQVAAVIFDKFRHKPFLNSCSVFLRCSRHQ